MKALIFKSAATGLLLLATSLFSEAQVQWSKIDEAIMSEEGRRILPERAAYFKIDAEALRRILSESGNLPQEGLRISLPDPEGLLHTFNVFKSGLWIPNFQPNFQISPPTQPCQRSIH